MIKSIIDIDGYWTIVLFADIDYNRFDIIESSLTDLLATTDTIDDIYDTVAYDYNKAFTYSNSYYRTSIVGINKTTSRDELIDSITHEIDHVQTTICKYYNIPIDSEDAAYLIGYLAKSFYRECSSLFCYY